MPPGRYAINHKNTYNNNAYGNPEANTNPNLNPNFVTLDVDTTDIKTLTLTLIWTVDVEIVSGVIDGLWLGERLPTNTTFSFGGSALTHWVSDG